MTDEDARQRDADARLGFAALAALGSIPAPLPDGASAEPKY